MPGVEISTDRDISSECLKSTREVGYQPDDRVRLDPDARQDRTAALERDRGDARTGHHRAHFEELLLNTLAA